MKIVKWNLDRNVLRRIYNGKIRSIFYPSYLRIEKNFLIKNICILIKKYLDGDGRTTWMNNILKVINNNEGDFEDGLTAIMVNRNEITFEDSIKSIIRYVDKIILVDAYCNTWWFTSNLHHCINYLTIHFFSKTWSNDIEPRGEYTERVWINFASHRHISFLLYFQVLLFEIILIILIHHFAA